VHISAALNGGECGHSYQAPGGVAAVQVNNSTEIVVQGDVNEETAGDQTTSLEKVVVVLGPGLLGLLFRQVRRGLGEAAILVDESKLLDNVVVETVWISQIPQLSQMIRHTGSA